MQIFREIQRIEPLQDGTIKAYGFASAPVRDNHGEIVTAQAMSRAIADYMRFPAVREMHDATKAAGRCLEISLDENDRTAFIAHVVDPLAVQKVKAGVYSGFSIGGRIKRRNSQDPTIIQEIDLTEVSLVDRPSCPAATLDLWKRDEDGPLGYAQRDLINSASREALRRADEDSNPADMTPAVDDFEDKGEWDDGFDPIKPAGPTSVASGGPYRSSVPDKGADAGRTSMPTDANSGKSPVGAGHRNATQDTEGRGLGASGHGDYFTPIPGAANKGDDRAASLQRLFDMLSDLYAESHRPPVEGADPIIQRRSFTAEQRRRAAKSGAAMKDGSYPIENRDDLSNAIRAIGRAKNRAVTMAHIKMRARAMGATSMLPEDWGGGKSDKSAESEGGLSNRQVDPARIEHIDGDNDPLATKLTKSGDLLQNTLAALERLEVRQRRGKATPEAYRLAKAYLEMDVDALAEVLAADALEKIAANDTKVATAEALAKRFKEDNEALLKQLEDTNAGLEQLAARLQKLEAQPMPVKTAGSVYAGDADQPNQFSPDAIAKAQAAFAEMTENERVTLLTKIALQHPRQMNLSPIKSPPRSVGGTAGGDQESNIR
jgi:phage head maturation protease